MRPLAYRARTPAWTLPRRNPRGRNAATRHAPANGDVLSTIDRTGNPSSGSGNVYGTPDGDLLIVYSADADPMTLRPIIERSTADGASTLWSSSIAGMPGVDGIRTDWADFLPLRP